MILLCALFLIIWVAQFIAKDQRILVRVCPQEQTAPTETTDYPFYAA